MKLVTNSVPVITNWMYPAINMEGNSADWSKVLMAEAGTVFKVKAVMGNQVFLENSKYSIWIDVSIFREFFTEHQEDAGRREDLLIGGVYGVRNTVRL